jgi:hypothetical protein
MASSYRNSDYTARKVYRWNSSDNSYCLPREVNGSVGLAAPKYTATKSNLPRKDNRKDKFFIVGDMVQITNKCHKMAGKFGLVEKIFDNKSFDNGDNTAILVKIGKSNFKLAFRDIRFCTRVGRVTKPRQLDRGLKTDRRGCVDSRIRKLVDLVDDDSENSDDSDDINDDNFGNR